MCRALMNNRITSLTFVVLSTSLVLNQPARSVVAQEIHLQAYKPTWHVGEQWIVETLNQPFQIRRSPTSAPKPRPVRWEFRVQAIEKIDRWECFKATIECLTTDGPKPRTTLWIDRQSMMLKRMQTELPFQGKVRTVTENYVSRSGQPAPVLTGSTVLPLDLPLFQAGTKGVEKFSYETRLGPEGTKAADEISFAYGVEQRMTPAKPDQVKGVLPNEYTKDLVRKPVIEVRLRTTGSEVRQLWQPGFPCPVYSDNGVMQARLIEVRRPHGR